MALSLSLARTLALCEKHRVSKLTSDGDTLAVEFFAPADLIEQKHLGVGPTKSSQPADHAHAPEVEAAVRALDEALDIDDDEPVRDVIAIIAEVDAANKAEK